MKREEFVSTRGRLVDITYHGEDTVAFIPPELPVEIEIDEELARLLAKAERNLGKLHELTRELDNPSLYYTPSLFREALTSSYIEGTRTSMEEVLERDITEEEILDGGMEGTLVHQLKEAIDHGLDRLNKEPLTKDLIKRLHDKTFGGVEGLGFRVGEFRAEQSHIGRGESALEVTFIPPPPDKVEPLLDNMIEYIQDTSDDIPYLMKIAVSHYQFEAIHPFEDGNGRIGRLLLLMFFCHRPVKKEPFLIGPFFNISDYILRNRQRYYELLMKTSTHGDYSGWIKFFLKGVIRQTDYTLEVLKSLEDLRQKYRKMVDRKGIPDTCKRTVDILFEMPIITIPTIEEALDVSYLTANKSVHALEELGILNQAGESRRPKRFIATEVFQELYKDYTIEINQERN